MGASVCLLDGFLPVCIGTEDARLAGDPRPEERGERSQRTGGWIHLEEWPTNVWGWR